MGQRGRRVGGKIHPVLEVQQKELQLFGAVPQARAEDQNVQQVRLSGAAGASNEVVRRLVAQAHLQHFSVGGPEAQRYLDLLCGAPVIELRQIRQIRKGSTPFPGLPERGQIPLQKPLELTAAGQFVVHFPERHRFQRGSAPHLLCDPLQGRRHRDQLSEHTVPPVDHPAGSRLLLVQPPPVEGEQEQDAAALTVARQFQ